jgi:ribose 1,5-bisphosphokinase
MLVLVVGPAGVGKDSLMTGCRALIAPAAPVRFVRREITRPADAGGEDHIAVTDEEFDARRKAGIYALWWRVDLGYGVSREMDVHLLLGRTVVINVSREILGEARRRYGPLKIVSIRAPLDLIEKRLVARGRETPERIRKKLARAAAFEVSGPDVIEVWNDGAEREGVACFHAAIEPLFRA